MADSPVLRTTVTVRLTEGLHLRPLTQLARVAQAFSATTLVRRGDQVVDAKRPLELMTLAAAYNEQLELETCGTDADAALHAMVQLFENNFSEDASVS